MVSLVQLDSSERTWPRIAYYESTVATIKQWSCDRLMRICHCRARSFKSFVTRTVTCRRSGPSSKRLQSGLRGRRSKCRMISVFMSAITPHFESGRLLRMEVATTRGEGSAIAPIRTIHLKSRGSTASVAWSKALHQRKSKSVSTRFARQSP